MNDFSAIDGFLDVFIRYIDSGFGLISGDVTSLAVILITIDVTLAALFWAWGSNTDIIQSLVKKTLYVGAFAYIFGNFAMLSTIILNSFATLGLNASAASFGPADLLKPGLIAAEGLAASQPIFDHIGATRAGPDRVLRQHAGDHPAVDRRHHRDRRVLRPLDPALRPRSSSSS